MKTIHTVTLLLLLTTVIVLISAQNENKERVVKNPPFQSPPFSVNPSKGRHGRRGGRTRDMEGVAGPSEGIRNLQFQRIADNNSVAPSESALVLPAVPRESDEGVTGSSPSETEGMLDRAIHLLQRLNDRLTALNALDEQQLRRLETLEYRLTKIEVQTQEKSDSIKSELREVSQRVRQLDWQSSKMEATLEAIKLDTNGLKHGQDQIRGLQAGSEAKSSGPAHDELNNKLQMMMTSVYTMRAVLGSLKDDFNVLKTNVTKLSNMTSHMMGLKLLTKQYFTNVMLDFKHKSASPVQVIPQEFLASINNHPPHDPNEERLPHDCLEVQQQGHNTSGIYRIKPQLSTVPFFVYCQLETRGGGWTVVQNRYEGTVDFYHDWQDYKHGFGNIGGEFWLGLEKLHTLTNYKVTELLIELQDFNLDNTYALYSAFAVGTEVEGYAISFLGSYEGDAGDSLVYHAGMKFSTKDMDHDNWHDGNCAESHTGAWWYNGCDTSNLNGRYLNGELPELYEYQGMYWYDWHGPGYSLMKSRISVRTSKHFHSYLRVLDPITTNNKTTKVQGKKIHPSANKKTEQSLHHHRNVSEHKPLDPEQSFTEQENHAQNVGIEDSPPTNGVVHHITEYPEQPLPYEDNIYDYQH